jgi:asparagine synthase (glutamine-hydrolysing)
MCGIAASFAYHVAAPPIDRDELLRVREYMAARGPDGAGAWFSDDGRVGLAHRRLAIIDPDARAAQPMRSVDGSAVLTYNGEIYNYRVLRDELHRAGVVLRTQSDTEVLLALYQRDGDRLFSRLRGMYAFAVWDARRGAMLLARDPYGIKPLYIADDGWTVRIASQVKALLASDRVSRAPESAAQVGLLLFGSAPEPFTSHRAVRAVPAGALQWIDESGPWAPRVHTSIAASFASSQADGEARDDAAIVTDAVRDSVAAHRVADVPVGAFLSAGVDSGTLVSAMAQDEPSRVQTCTLAFAEFRDTQDDELPLAREIARTLGVAHHAHTISRADFDSALPQLLADMDQPGIDGINTWFVARACRELGMKVAISGVGGDELFAGYSSFDDVPRWRARTRFAAMLPGLGRTSRMLAAPLLARQSRINPKAAGLLELGPHWAGAWLLRRGVFMPWELREVLPRDVVEDGLARLDWRALVDRTLDGVDDDATARVAALEAQLYLRNQLLRDADWAGMAHGLEIRTPLVDIDMLRTLAPRVARFRHGAGKRLLAASAPTPLPAAVTQRAKTGFSTPLARWIETNEALSGWRRVPHVARGPAHASRRLAVAMLHAQGLWPC